MPSGNTNVSGSENGARREEAAVALPDQRRVQALLDRRPDRERRREVIALDHEVARRRARRSRRSRRTGGRPRSGRTRRRARARRRCPRARAGPPLSHSSAAANCSSPSITARQLVRALGMRLRQRHRHVEVVQPAVERGVEDRRVQPRVARVDDHVGPLVAGERDDRRAVRPRRPAPRRSGRRRAGRRPPRALAVEVGERPCARRSRGGGRWRRQRRRRRPPRGRGCA